MHKLQVLCWAKSIAETYTKMVIKLSVKSHYQAMIHSDVVNIKNTYRARSAGQKTSRVLLFPDKKHCSQFYKFLPANRAIQIETIVKS